MIMTKLTVSEKIYAPLKTVRAKRNTPEDIMQRNHAWDDRHCPSSTVDLREGGLFSSTMSARDGSFSFDFTGQYDVIQPMNRIEYTMGAFEKHFVPAGRKCTVLFEEDGSCGCVTVTEIFDAEEVHDHQMQISGWQAILENFKKHVENSL
jgi:uncharacterized protein YndB with AHSA1/START domain